MTKRRMLSLEELMGRVEDAFYSCGIEVVAFEVAAGGAEERAARSTDSLHRLTRCLRSHGVLDEYTTEPTRNPS